MTALAVRPRRLIDTCVAVSACQVCEGSIVGACEMVDGGPRMHTVRAGPKLFVELMVLDAERFHDIMTHFPKVAR